MVTEADHFKRGSQFSPLNTPYLDELMGFYCMTSRKCIYYYYTEAYVKLRKAMRGYEKLSEVLEAYARLRETKRGFVR